MGILRNDVFIGARVRRLRLAAGITQRQLGERLGVTYQQIQKYESGRSQLTLGKMQKLAAALGVPYGAILEEGREGDLSQADLVSEKGSDYGPARLSGEEKNFLRLFRGLPEKRLRESLLFLMRRLARIAAAKDSKSV